MRSIYQVSMSIMLMVVTLSIFTTTVDGAGLGIMPAHIELSNLLKGGIYYRSIRVFNPGEKPITLTLAASGSIASWVTFYMPDNLNESINNITVTKKQEVFVKFTVPADIANGLYEGTVYAETLPPDTLENASTGYVKIRLPVSISATVTGTQILDGNVTEIKTSDVESGYPLHIRIGFINTGNVKARPIVRVNITRAGWLIANVTYSNTVIDVDSADFIVVQWNTTDREPGSYEATVTITLGQKVLIKKTLAFEILPRGFLTRKGEITNITYIGDPTIGNTIKILADFKNTGRVETKAKFIGEVYKNNELTKVLESEEVLVPVGNTFTFTTYLKINNPGEYYINGYVIYETNKTSIKTLSFNVPGISLDVLLIGGVVGLAAVFITLSLLNKKRKIFKPHEKGFFSVTQDPQEIAKNRAAKKERAKVKEKTEQRLKAREARKKMRKEQREQRKKRRRENRERRIKRREIRKLQRKEKKMEV